MQKLCTEKKQKVVVYKMRKEEEAMETAEEKQDPRSRNAEHTVGLSIYSIFSYFDSHMCNITGILASQL